MKRYLVLTGAGISAESGIRTFRDSGGLWEEHRVEDVASPQGFQKNPKLVWDFYKERFKNSLSVNPNSAHQALKRMEDALGENFHLITQNVDGLHIKAGNRRVYEMHGSLKNCFCVSCRTRYELDEIDLSQDVPLCMKCKALLRPDIVWFGEIPYYLYEIEDKLKNCDVFIVVGTSGTVYPAAGFVMTAKLFGAKTIAVNLDRPDNLGFIDEFLQGKSGELVPPLVEKLIG
ncbi:MAG: NAD-dependent deacylase [Candidatus Cloacimonetes bacterium]|nr:NAD-dependent deacylase [Candidatus Cloacimonadota bacterium]